MYNRNSGSPEQFERVRVPRGKEILGIIESMLGANKMRVRCQDNKIRICRIPGRLRKRIWMREGDTVLIEPWSIQGDKSADIVYKYNPTQASWLRRKGILKIEY
ncbi:MAG TPA: translation initiation factor eIF-1A [Candidatus Brocadiales bacterium]|nr:translation initiation factor eIF-1A [Candidatus Brocadiales bacterium]